MTLHVHWHRPTGPVRGPFIYGRRVSALIGTRTLVCRCGSQRTRDEVAMPADLRSWEAVTVTDPPSMSLEPPPPPPGHGAASARTEVPRGRWVAPRDGGYHGNPLPPGTVKPPPPRGPSGVSRRACCEHCP